MKNYVKIKRPVELVKLTSLANGQPSALLRANNMECEALISNKVEIPKDTRKRKAWIRIYESGAILVTGFTDNE